MSRPPGGTDVPSGLRSLSVTIDTSEIASPHDFGFQLRHYVVAPEVREGEKLVEIVRLGSGRLVKIDVVSAGTVDEPRLELTVFSADPLTPSDVGEARRLVAWRLGLEDDLRPFYELAQGDPVLSASIAYNYGAKGKTAFSMFDAVIDVICAQNTAFRRLYAMRANLAAAFGDPFATEARVYHASPAPARGGAHGCHPGVRGGIPGPRRTLTGFLAAPPDTSVGR